MHVLMGRRLQRASSNGNRISPLSIAPEQLSIDFEMKFNDSLPSNHSWICIEMIQMYLFDDDYENYCFINAPTNCKIKEHALSNCCVVDDMAWSSHYCSSWSKYFRNACTKANWTVANELFIKYCGSHPSNERRMPSFQVSSVCVTFKSTFIIQLNRTLLLSIFSTTYAVRPFSALQHRRQCFVVSSKLAYRTQLERTNFFKWHIKRCQCSILLVLWRHFWIETSLCSKEYNAFNASTSCHINKITFGNEALCLFIG
jgi:hypothetical protein